MDKLSAEQSRIQGFLASPVFSRSFEVMETYQKLLTEAADDEVKRNLIKHRLRTVFAPKQNEQTDQRIAVAKNEMDGAREKMLAWCENGELTKEKLAGLYAGLTIGEQLLAHWNPKSDRATEKGKLANEVIEYVNHPEEPKDLILNIVTTPVKGTEQLIQKITEGLKIVAKELQSGTLQHVEKLRLTSWLFDFPFIKAFLSQDVKLEELADDNEEAQEIQRLALSYNKRAMQTYLESGQLPKVKKLVLTKDEFLSKISQL